MLSLPQNGNYSSEVIFGSKIEDWVLTQLTTLGYAARPLRLWTDRFDLLITGTTPLLIEVKAAHETRRKVRPGYYRPRWQFKIGNRPKLDHVIILVAVDHDGQRWPYVVPSWLFFGRHHVQLTSHPSRYSGMFAEYLNAWQTIKMVMTTRQHTIQLPLFDLMECAA